MAQTCLMKTRLKKVMEISRMNYYFTGILIVLMTLLAFCGGPARAGSTQSNVSGSNTAIEGGYTSTATTTYQSGSESTSLYISSYDSFNSNCFDNLSQE